MDIVNVGRFCSRDLNAVLRIARLVMGMASTNEFYDLEIDGLSGFVIVKKWRRTPTGGGDELTIVTTMMWKPGIRVSANGYYTLHDIQKWLEAERDVHVEAALELNGEERGG